MNFLFTNVYLHPPGAPINELMDNNNDWWNQLPGNVLMGSSVQHLERPKPLSLPPQEAARWVNLVSRPALFSWPRRVMKLLRLENM